MLRVQTQDGAWSNVVGPLTAEQLMEYLAEARPADVTLVEVYRPGGREWVNLAHVARVIEA